MTTGQGQRINAGLPADTSVSALLSSTSYPSSTGDWKGLFIQRLVEALARRSDIDLALWSPPGPIPGAVRMAWQGRDAGWLDKLSLAGGIAHLLRTKPAQGLVAAATLLWRLRRANRRADARLFHVNWLQNAIALPPDSRPALVTALGSDMALLRLPLMKPLLRRAFRRRRTIICPNADWMVQPLVHAFGDLARVECVPFGVDASWYAINRQVDPGTPRRWLCISRLTTAKLGPLFEWAAPHFSDSTRELHLFGPKQEADIRIPAWVHFHGPATPEELRRDWIPTATGLVSLSQHAEGRPQVMLEAMAAGLPILASRLPAHEDIIDHAQDGWLCDDPVGFAAGLSVIEDPRQNDAFGATARTSAQARFGDWDACAGRYVRLYADLLGHSST